jgi:hypothetical protein
VSATGKYFATITLDTTETETTGANTLVGKTITLYVSRENNALSDTAYLQSGIGRFDITL